MSLIKIKPLYYLFSFLAGCLLFLAFEPFNIIPLAVLVPAGLFYLLLQAQQRKQHLYLVWSFGFGMFATGTHWIYYSVHFFGGAHWILAVLLTLLFALLIGTFLLLFGLSSYYFRSRTVLVRLLLLFPASWVLLEWFRGWFLTGFPWLLLGQSQIDTPLANIAPITGVLGVSYLVATLAGLSVFIFISPLKPRLYAISLSVLLIVTTWGLGFIQWTQPIDSPIKVSLLQGNVAQENKWQPEYHQPTLELYREMTEKSWDSDLIIWPETAIPDWFGAVSEQLIEPLRSAAYVEQSDLLVGGFYSDGQASYNSIMAITAAGGTEIYSKHHRVPFSEYIPFLEHLRFLERWIRLPYDSVGKGTGKTTLAVAQQIAQMSICYEDVYGNESIAGLPEATLLVNLSNDGWFADSIEPMQHMQIARMRALEAGRYLLRATNTGISAIVNEKGRIIHTADPYITTIIKGQAQGFSGATPYVLFGNGLIITIMFTILGIFGVIRRN
jgi:apolipoprotein N-acyltransferase